jgi:hypothetical protein
MEPATSDVRHTLVPRTVHRRTQAVLVAATVVAAVLAVVAVAWARSGGAPFAAGSPGGPPVLHVSLPDAGAPAAAASSADARVKGGGLMPYAPFGYRLAGSLPTEPTRAPVVRLGERGPAPRDVVDRIASALGLPAPVAPSGDDWVVRSGGAVLRVYGYPGHPWVYARADVVPCPPLSLTGFTGPGGTVACGFAVTERPPADAAVLAAATPVLRAVGLDPSDATVGYGWANADPPVDGEPTAGIGTSVNVDSRGVRSVTGWLPEPTDGAVYPLLSARAVYDALLAEPRPMLGMPCRVMPNAPANAAPTCPSFTTVITGAEPALVLGWGKDGPLLVPAWSFTVRHGQPIVRVAVQPRYLGEPPSTAGTGTGAGSTGGGVATGAPASVGPATAPTATASPAPSPARS